MEKVKICVSGAIYETYQATIDRFPGTLLSDEEARKQFWDEDSDMYFFDRNAAAFAGILYFYQSHGKLVKPYEVPDTVFDEEVEFFGLENINSSLEENMHLIMARRRLVIVDPLILSYQRFRERRQFTIKSKIWLMMEYPNKSTQGRILGAIDIIFVCLSLITACYTTTFHFQIVSCFNETWFTESNLMYNCTKEESGCSREQCRLIPREKHLFITHWVFYLELLTAIWMVIHYFLRLITCPFKKVQFMSSIDNCVQIVSLLPDLFQLIILAINIRGEPIICSDNGYLRSFVILRTMRVVRLIHYLSSLRALLKTLKLYSLDFINFLLYNFVGMAFFGSLVYIAEERSKQDRATIFSSAPDAFWWAIITLTTVGYGDTVPITTFGKLIGSVCLIAGAFTVSLPVPIISSKFRLVYQTMQNSEKKFQR
ncbi:Potassium voltage-gated channel subfamily A member 3 [Cichlidogyrus casuarinus]|uniref:Potassium voltage-gated channel subfamily A member 3 n=1 Tax=Cichlidogyrus casuarinus TaxID=1844966 RepID=A0ABD2QHA8_9PLAT